VSTENEVDPLFISVEPFPSSKSGAVDGENPPVFSVGRVIVYRETGILPSSTRLDLSFRFFSTTLSSE